MIPIQKLLVTLAVVCSVQALSLAQDELVLKDHHHLLHGEVVSSTPDSVTFKHVVNDTADTQTYPADAIDPHSFYIVRSRAVDGDAAGKVVLAKYCEANGLFTRASDLYFEAMKLDSSLKLQPDIDRCEQETGKGLLENAKALAKDGKDEEATREAAALIRTYAGTPIADQARELSKTTYQGVVQKREAALAAHEARGGNEEIRAIQKELHRAADTNSKALQEQEGSASQHGFEQAIQEYREALKKAEDLAKKVADNADLTKEAGDLLAQAKSELIEVYINLGSCLMVQTDYQGAMKQANAALGVDPDSGTAKSFRARVASASSESEINVYGPAVGARPIRR